MRAHLAALLLVLASSNQAPAQASCEGDAKADLELVQKIGSRKAYETFLGARRTGPCADIARQQLQQMDPHGMTRENWGDQLFIQEKIDRRQ